MPFVMQKEVDKLRKRLGDPLPFEIEDDAIKDAINSALTEYSKYRPQKKESLVNLTTGQSLYEMEQGVMGVVDCILSFRGGSPDFIPVNAYDDPFLQISRSLRMIDELNNEDKDRYGGYEWTYLPSTNQLKIFPAPSFTGQTSVVVKLAQTEETFPEIDMELLLKYAQAESMETLGHFRTKVKSLPTGVGFKMVLDGGETLLEKAERKRQEFYDEIRSGGTWIVTG